MVSKTDKRKAAPLLDAQLCFALYSTSLSMSKLYRKLFLTETSLAGKLNHPHICQIYDAVAD